MISPTGQACGACFFWLSRGGGQKGECRRFPPTTIQGRAVPPDNVPDHMKRNWRQVPEHYFPLTLPDQWCGEFKCGP